LRNVAYTYIGLYNGVASVRTVPDLCENRHIFAVAVLH